MPDDFYASLPSVDAFEALATPDVYRPLPEGWSVVAADVTGSTDAIAAGHYKAVNIVGVAVIAAVRNATRPVEVPYVFGGDGAVLCVPDRLVAEVRDALAATVAMARDGHGLTLRAGIVPVAWIRERGLDVLVARHRVSEHYVQCALFGGGAEHVEQSLKDGRLPEELVVEADDEAAASYRGLECRWREIPSPAEETVAVIVEAAGARDEALTLFRWVVERVARIYGEDAACRPVVEGGLKVAFLGRALGHETAVHHWRERGPGRLLSHLKLRFYSAIGWLLMALGVRTETVRWGEYRRDVVTNTDFRKFDGALRFVFAGSAEQRRELREFLERLRSAGMVRYGMHVAHSALMTCLIDHRQGGHFHFVDASGGGYAAAAAELKRKG